MRQRENQTAQKNEKRYLFVTHPLFHFNFDRFDLSFPIEKKRANQKKVFQQFSMEVAIRSLAKYNEHEQST